MGAVLEWDELCTCRHYGSACTKRLFIWQGTGQLWNPPQPDVLFDLPAVSAGVGGDLLGFRIYQDCRGYVSGFIKPLLSDGVL